MAYTTVSLKTCHWPLQAKADAARQEAETVTAENSQLGAHLQLLESELESARHGPGTDSAEGSPRQSQQLAETIPHGLTPSHLDLPEASAVLPSAVSGALFFVNANIFFLSCGMTTLSDI